MSEACVSPLWKHIDWQRAGQGLMTIPWSDHNAAPSPDGAETDPEASSKDRKRSCQSSFAGVHSSQHLTQFTATCVCHVWTLFSSKCEASKSLQNESFLHLLSSIYFIYLCLWCASRQLDTVHCVSFITLFRINIASPSLLGFYSLCVQNVIDFVPVPIK